MRLEPDTFVRIENLGDHKVVVMRHECIPSCTIPGLQSGEFRLDENSLRGRIANLKRDGYPTDQSEAALKALETAINMATGGKHESRREPD